MPPFAQTSTMCHKVVNFPNLRQTDDFTIEDVDAETDGIYPYMRVIGFGVGVRARAEHTCLAHVA